MMTSGEWVEMALKRKLTPDQHRMVGVVCTIASPYNLQMPGLGWDEAQWFNGDKGMSINIVHTDLATYDGGELTRLVLAAHREAIRVSIRPTIVFERIDYSEGEWVREATHDHEEDDCPLEVDSAKKGYCCYPRAVLEIQTHVRSHTGTRFYDKHPTIEEAFK